MAVLGEVLEDVRRSEGGRVDMLAVTGRVGASAPAVDQARQVMRTAVRLMRQADCVLRRRQTIPALQKIDLADAHLLVACSITIRSREKYLVMSRPPFIVCLSPWFPHPQFKGACRETDHRTR